MSEFTIGQRVFVKNITEEHARRVGVIVDTQLDGHYLVKLDGDDWTGEVNWKDLRAEIVDKPNPKVPNDHYLYKGEALVGSYHLHDIPEEADPGTWSGSFHPTDGGVFFTGLCDTEEQCRDFIYWALNSNLEYKDWAVWEGLGYSVKNYKVPFSKLVEESAQKSKSSLP